MHITRQHSEPTGSSEMQSLGASGFALIEALITILVIAVGLLGLAGMQFTGLRANHQAHATTQASLLAADISDRMRANRAAAQDGLYEYTKGTPPQNPGYDCVKTFPTQNLSCSAAQLVNADLFEWYRQIDPRSWQGSEPQTLLSQGRAEIRCTGGCADGVYEILIMWDEDGDGTTDHPDRDPPGGGNSGEPNEPDPFLRVNFLP